MTLPKLLLDICATSQRVTGIERVGGILRERLAAHFELELLTAHTIQGLAGSQYVRAPAWLARHRRGILLTATFPPSLIVTAFYAQRVIPYIHDLFLLSRSSELNRNAKIYMVPAFRQALRRCSAFLTNSETSRIELVPHCSVDAEILVVRPIVDDIFSIGHGGVPTWDRKSALRLLAISTVEPRKGLRRAARFRAALEGQLGGPVRLDIVGRRGWGGDWEMLANEPNVHLWGYLPTVEVRRLILNAHFFLSASYDEGLGLPLLEAQHGSKAVIASDIPIYREVLGTSGLLVDFEKPVEAASQVARFLDREDIAAAGRRGRDNVARWNAAAQSGLNRAIAMLAERTSGGVKS